VKEAAAGRLEVTLGPEQAGRRLDAVLAEGWPEQSRAAWQELIAAGLVTLDGKPAKAAQRVRAGQRIVVAARGPLQGSAPHAPARPVLPLVVYEDEDMVVVHKPAGLVVHPAPGHVGTTLVEALLGHSLAAAGDAGAERLSSAPADDADADGEPDGPAEAWGLDEERPGIVHRLDKDTSGLLVVARHRAAQAHLSAQFKARTVRKRYWALVEGHPRPPAGAIEAPIDRDPRYRARMAVVAGGRAARTTYRTRETFAAHALLDVGLETGRTHQIRVHLASIGHPVAGDPLYGVRPPTIALDHQFLHAYRLELDSPSRGERLVFEAALPPDLQTVLDGLRAREP
jgi:23S rRNA pseudouridine1911/1915/1917 synthase